MIPIYRFLEVALYSLLNSVPFLVLAVYPFRQRLRFSAPGTVLAAVLMGLLQIATGFLAAFCAVSPGILSLFTTGLCIVFYVSLVKDRFGRLLFVLLVLSNIANLVTTLAKCLEGLLFGDLALQAYRWSLCLCLVIMHVLVTTPLAFFIRRYFTAGIPIQTNRWRWLWLIPAVFYAIWYSHLYFADSSSLHVALDYHNALFLLFLNIAALLVYHTTILLLLEQKKAAALIQENYLLSLQKIQHDNLQQRINEARQAKHDLRHHTHLIREYLRSGKFQELEAYLDHYTSTLPEAQSLVYCRNYAVNTLLNYYCQQAKSRGVEMDVFVQLPEKIHLPETTLSVVLGNLLENAIEACEGMDAGKRRITVRGKATMGSVFFEITNPYKGALQKTKTGAFLSTKSSDRGLGLESVAALAKAHGGMLELDAQNGTFRASILLTEQPRQ